jgi:hypothetical protein
MITHQSFRGQLLSLALLLAGFALSFGLCYSGVCAIVV